MKILFWELVLILSLYISYDSFHSSNIYASQLQENFSMDEQWKREFEAQFEEDFLRPWSQRRGIESIDRNSWIVLARVPLAQLSAVLAEKAVESRRDVLGTEIEVRGSFAFAYQLVGHNWSIVSKPPSESTLTERSELAALSARLGQPVIELGVSDTSATVGYNLFEGGKLIEHFEGQEYEDDEDDAQGLPTQKYILHPYPDDPEAEQVAYFWSSRRKVTVQEIGNIWDFAEELMLEYDAFDPAIDDTYLLGDYPKRGKIYWVTNRGYTLVLGSGQEVRSIPEFIRVDYFRFRK